MAKTIYKSLPEANLERRRNISFDFSYEDIKVPSTLKEYAKGRKYFIHTYGCQANYRDQEIMAGLLEKAGFCQANSEKDADVIILNTCAVRENAEQKVFGKIGDLKALKLANKDRVIAICGCMVQQKHIIEHIHKTYHHVDLVFGTHNIIDLLSLLDEVISKHIKVIDVKSLPGDIHENLPSVRQSNFKAFVNISRKRFNIDYFYMFRNDFIKKR